MVCLPFGLRAQTDVVHVYIELAGVEAGGGSAPEVDIYSVVSFWLFSHDPPLVWPN
jgi:hypothetical protein